MGFEGLVGANLKDKLDTVQLYPHANMPCPKASVGGEWAQSTIVPLCQLGWRQLLHDARVLLQVLPHSRSPVRKICVVLEKVCKHG